LQDDIQNEFGRFGEIASIRYKGGNERGLVVFIRAEDASNALKHFQTKQFLGCRIRVAYHDPSDLKPESPQVVQEVRVKQLDDVVAKETEVIEILKNSWDDFCESTPHYQGSLTFNEIVQCLDKIPYEMAQPWTNPNFRDEIQKMTSNVKEVLKD